MITINISERGMPRRTRWLVRRLPKSMNTQFSPGWPSSWQAAIGGNGFGLIELPGLDVGYTGQIRFVGRIDRKVRFITVVSVYPSSTHGSGFFDIDGAYVMSLWLKKIR